METQNAIPMTIIAASSCAFALGTPSRKPWHTSVLAHADRDARRAIALAPDSAPPGTIPA